MKAARVMLGIVGVTALCLSWTTSAQVPWAVVAMIAGLATFAVILLERRASR